MLLAAMHGQFSSGSMLIRPPSRPLRSHVSKSMSALASCADFRVSVSVGVALGLGLVLG